MIKLIVIGKLKEGYLVKQVLDYAGRIRKYHKLEIIELKEEKSLEIEANNILKYIKSEDYVISLEIEGKELTSEEVALKIDKIFNNYSTIVFVVGSSLGLDAKIKQRSNFLWSFSKLTFPHGLFRAVLLEQIYRAFKILNNESYHK